MTREEIEKSLRICIGKSGCAGCSFKTEPLLLPGCLDNLLSAVAEMLEQDVRSADMVPKDYHDRCMEMEIERRMLLEQIHKKTVAEVCALRDQVHNLTLYLQEAFNLCPEVLKVLEKWHPGLPGYAPEGQEEKNA